MINWYNKIFDMKKKDGYDVFSVSNFFYSDLISLYGENIDDFGKDIRKLYNSYINNKIDKKLLYKLASGPFDISAYNSLKCLLNKNTGHIIDNKLLCDKQSVSEHIFSSICVANYIYDTYGIDIDINKVNSLIFLYYARFLNNDNNNISKLINESIECESKEARFAYRCRTLDYILQSRVYLDRNLYSDDSSYSINTYFSKFALMDYPFNEIYESINDNSILVMKNI